MPFLLGSEEHTSELQSPCNLVCRFFLDRKSTRLNSSHLVISYAVFCLKKKKPNQARTHFLLGLSLMHQETQPDAPHDFRAARALEPTDATAKFFFFLLMRHPPK